MDASSPAKASKVEWRTPPRRSLGILRSLGPGLIIAASIVGSGELVATTKTGAEAGFWLLWLILIGCVIKVFAQIEFGRDAITHGEGTLGSLNQVPGPRLRVNWIVWYWFFMILMSMAQLGGIVGGVGQALAISTPLTSNGREFNLYQDRVTRREVLAALVERTGTEAAAADPARMERLQSELAKLNAELTSTPVPSESQDDVMWALLLTIVTAIVLVRGRYRLIQTLATILVAMFTFVTLWNLFALQSLPDWRVTWAEFTRGLSFRLPPAAGAGVSPVATALAAFGIIGVGATELVAYPYWCLEKGYAKWTGPREESQAWVERARGWIKVLHWDAFMSAVVYTFATGAFYLLGAAVLGRANLNPAGSQMIRTLSEMYVPVFGGSAHVIFLFGAISVLYSTFFVASAGHARVLADAFRVFGLVANDEATRQFWVKVFSGLTPACCFVVYVFVKEPVFLILMGGVAQAIMLPMLAYAALYFRYRRCHPQLLPGRWWDFFLWVSSVGLVIAGVWAALSRLLPALG